MANLLSNTTIGGYQSIHTGNIGSYAITSLSGYATQSYVTSQGYITNTNQYYYVNPGAGNGIGFWTQAPTTYGITMAHTSAGYGAIYDNSEYYLYFTMTNGGERGFIFRNDYGAIAQLASNGWLMTRGEIYPGYNNGGGGGQTSYYIYGNTNNAGLRTNGNWLVNGNLYIGSRDVWFTDWFNQAVRTDSNPSFASIYLNGTQLTGTQTQQLKNTLDVTTLPYKVDITVNGDANTFYAVQFWGGDQDVWRRIIIKRGYGETAPWDPIGTGVHHGGLLLDWEGNFGGWGGAEYADRIRVFNESYTNVCADMFIWSHSMGYVFMLRGGGAIYHLFSDQPINGFYQAGAPDIAYSTSTLLYDDTWSGTNQYDVPAPAPLTLAQVNSSRIDGLRTKKQSLLDNRYLRQGVDISGIGTVTATNFIANNAFYLNGTSYYLNSSNGGIYTNARFETGSNLVVGGNSYLGNGNGDEVHINDILRVGATDSGDAHIFFGEGGSAGSDYGAHLYWDSGYRFTWYTRNAGTDSTLFYYDTNSLSYITWGRSLSMNTNSIDYTGQLHFSGGTRFQSIDTHYLKFRTDATDYGSIQVRDGNESLKGHLGYFDANGFGLLNSSGSWGIRLNPGNGDTILYSGGNWKLTTTSAGISVNGNVYIDQNYGHGIVGLYASDRYQGVFAMGDSYKLSADGTSTGTLYGIAWTHTNVGGQSKPGLGHQALFMDNGNTQTAIGTGIWTNGLITTTSYGTSANWKAAYDWGNHASAGYLTSLPSHNHDDRYYTETESDGRYLRFTGAELTEGNYFYFRSNRGAYLGALDSPSLQVYASGSNAAFMSFHRGGSYAVNFGLDADNVMRIGGWSAGADRWVLDMSGNNTVAGSFRAPIFYDSANTNYYGDFASTSVMNAIRFGGSTNNATLLSDSEWGIRLSTDVGYIQFGPANSSYAHIYTDRATFYFNRDLLVNGNTVITAATIGSQSVSYASTAGALSSMNISQFTNNSGYITSSSLSSYLPLAGGTMSGKIFTLSTGTGTYDGAFEIRETSYVTTSQSAWGYAPGITYHWGGRAVSKVGLRSDGLFAIDDEPFATRSWTNSQGFLTSINSTQVTNALGYTPYNSSNPNGYVTSSGSVNYATTAGSAPNGSNSNQFYDVNAGVGNGLRFWNGSSAYKISMGVGSLYQYGPVTDYSIKMQMNDGDTGRGFTWGRESYAPIAALNSTSGDMEIAGYMKSYGYRGNGNVGGTGTASWHPDGSYVGSTQWLYGTMYKNGSGIYDVGQLKMNGGPYLEIYNTRNLIVRAADSNDVVGISGQKSSGGFAFQIYGDGSNYGFLNNTWGGWDIRKTVSGAMYMNNNDSYYLQTNSTSNFYALNIQGSAVVHAGNIGSQSVSYATTAGTANAVAWGNVSGRPTNLSQFTNDLGNYGGFLTSITAHTHAISDISGLQTALDGKQAAGSYAASSHTHDDRYYTESESDTRFARKDTDSAISGNLVIGNGTYGSSTAYGNSGARLMFSGSDGDAQGNYYIGTNHNDYGGNYSKLELRWHTGIRMGAQPGYGGIRFYDTEDLGTVIFSVGTGDSHVRVTNNLYVGGNLALHAGNYNSYSPTLTGGNASGTWGINVTGSAGSVAWTNVSSRPTALSQFSNDLGNYGGWLTTGGKAADSELFDGTDSIYFVKGNGVNTLGRTTTNYSGGNSAGGLSSGFYDGSGMSNMPTTDWYHLIVNSHYNSATSNQYEFQLATAFWDKSNFYVRSISPGDVGPWRTLIHNGNIGSQSVNYANSAGSASSATTATTATVASQLNKFGDIYGQDWNAYYIQDKFIAAAVYGHSGANRPNLTYDYGVMLSYGETSGPLMQMYFPENSPNLGTIFRKATYRTGWNGNWSTWKTLVEQEGNTCTIVGGNQTGMEIHANVGYNQDPLTYFLLRGQADTSWKALKIRLTGDAGGQDIEFRRIAENGADARMFYVPRGANQVIFEYQFVQGSDSRLKDNIIPITNSLDKVKSLRGVEFDWNSGVNEGTHDVGLIAQDVEAVLPEAVTTQEDGYKNLAYTKVIPLLVEAMKEQQAMIDALKAEIELLKNK